MREWRRRRRATDAGRTERRLRQAGGCDERVLGSLRRCGGGGGRSAQQSVRTGERMPAAYIGALALRLAELVLRRAAMRDGAETGIGVGVRQGVISVAQ